MGEGLIPACLPRPKNAQLGYQLGAKSSTVARLFLETKMNFLDFRLVWSARAPSAVGQGRISANPKYVN